MLVKQLASSHTHTLRKCSVSISSNRRFIVPNGKENMSMCMVNSANETGSIHNFRVPSNASTWEQTIEMPNIGDISHVMITPNQNIDDIQINFENDPVCLKFRACSDSDALFERVPEFSLERKVESDMCYKSLKADISKYSLIHSVVGTGLTTTLLGPSDGLAFGTGAVLAIMYNTMLQKDTDTIGSTSKLTVERTTRMLFVTVFMATIIHCYADEIRQHNIYYILGVLGFLSHKMAILRSGKSHTS